ncbi:MAG: HNH endonuclease [Leptolyngbyaceae cyanobacterium RM2_2_4]|nr:HNH endonuclease [Leptolyngbyaceae cyanobacterium RM2_2_4]
MDLITLNECVSCNVSCSKKLVKSLCSKCYRNQYKKTQICIDCKDLKTNTFVKGRCQSCRTSYDRLVNPNTYAKSRAKNQQKIAKYVKEYDSSHQKEKNAREAKRRSVKIEATPKWVDLDKIQEFYKNCPAGMGVDHIIPLNNKEVCGLHVIENLQYLTKEENRRKAINSTAPHKIMTGG